MLWSPVSEACDVCYCTRLFRNGFQIRGTPEGSVKKSLKTRSRRVIGMASSPELRELTSCSPCARKNLTGSAICSPRNQNSTPHKSGFTTRMFTKPRFPLEEFDPNSQDSGYGGCSDEKLRNNSFQFAEPLGVAPRRLSLESRCSPMKSPVASSPQRKRPALFRSLSSGYESTDDGFNELIDMDSLEDDLSHLPNGLCSLISGDLMDQQMPMEISTTPEAPSQMARPSAIRPGIRRSFSYQAAEESSPPSASKVRSCLFRSPNASSSTAKLIFAESRSMATSPPVRKFKRPEPPVNHSPVLVKRSRKCTSFQDVRSGAATACSPPPALMRSLSETEAHAHIKSAIHRSTTDADLTGDFSKPCVLPLAEGQHEDLKSISAETLSRLMNGGFEDVVSDFKIVDCRYPYEYEAGHIKGALNLYSKDMIEKFLLDPLTHTPCIEPEANKRNIIVFHCEFSWERGPNLSRFLRNIDRQRNKEHYPALHYPEIYLLHGGYQQFYKEQQENCTGGYRPMRHPDNEADLRQFRSKSKSWQGEKNNRTNVVTARANLKRLGF